MEFLIAAISLGFLGSFHCIGMCGPIALALPVHHKPRLVKNLLIALYNLGRITAYSCFGIIAGAIGKTIAMAGFQQGLSIGVGILLLLSGIITFGKGLPHPAFFTWLKSSLQHLFSSSTRSSLFLIGFLNGCLPCGLVYTGIAGATATGDIMKGLVFMMAFGAGTAPMMFALPLIGSRISVSAKSAIRKVTPVVVVVMALLLIVRGLNLGIPYISPKVTQDRVACCKETTVKNRQIIKCCKPVPKTELVEGKIVCTGTEKGGS